MLTEVRRGGAEEYRWSDSMWGEVSSESMRERPSMSSLKREGGWERTEDARMGYTKLRDATRVVGTRNGLGITEGRLRVWMVGNEAASGTRRQRMQRGAGGRQGGGLGAGGGRREAENRGLSKGRDRRVE